MNWVEVLNQIRPDTILAVGDEFLLNDLSACLSNQHLYMYCPEGARLLKIIADRPVTLLPNLLMVKGINADLGVFPMLFEHLGRECMKNLKHLVLYDDGGIVESHILDRNGKEPDN